MWFLAALLLALASAVVPALFPAGSLTSRVDGSAFDPSTSAVALQTRQEVPLPALARIDDGSKSGTGTAPPAVWHPAPTSLVADDATAHPASPANRLSDMASGKARTSQPRVRGPPRKA